MREVIRENMHRDSKWPSQSVEEHVIQAAAEAAAREIGIASLKEKPCFLPTISVKLLSLFVWNAAA